MNFLFIGLGAGLMSNAAYGTFNYYFVKRRMFAMSLAQILKGLILVGYPIVVGFCMNTYGFRGTAAIVAAINTNVIIAMYVMHPVEWHYKEIQVPVVEREMHPRKYQSHFQFDFFLSCFKFKFSLLISVMNTKIDIVDTQKDPIKIQMSNLPENEKKSNQQTIIEKIVDFLDLNLLKDAIYVNIVAGFTFAMFSDNMFSTLLPVYMMDNGFSNVCIFRSLCKSIACFLLHFKISLFFQTFSSQMWL